MATAAARQWFAMVRATAHPDVLMSYDAPGLVWALLALTCPAAAVAVRAVHLSGDRSFRGPRLPPWPFTWAVMILIVAAAVAAGAWLPMRAVLMRHDGLIQYRRGDRLNAPELRWSEAEQVVLTCSVGRRRRHGNHHLSYHVSFRDGSSVNLTSAIGSSPYNIEGRVDAWVEVMRRIEPAFARAGVPKVVGGRRHRESCIETYRAAVNVNLLQAFDYIVTPGAYAR